MKTQTMTLIFAISIVFQNKVCSQEPLSTDYPFLRKVQVAVSVSKRASDPMSFYSYSLLNDTSSRGSIQEFDLDISQPPNSMLVDTMGLGFKGSFSEGHFRRRYSELVGLIVPVSTPSLPPYWLGLFGNDLTISIGNDTIFVAPGEKVEGLTVMSKGLPGIRRFLTRPDFNVFEFFPSLEDTAATMTFAQMDSIREAVNFRGLTIGPTAPPAHFIP